MSGIAIVFLTLSIVLVWGGLVASTIFLSMRPDLLTMPAGGEDDDRDEETGPIIHDT